MNEQPARVHVKILDKDYQVACPPSEKEALLLAADELDKRMRKIKNSGAMVGVDRIAVMVALNLCHELHESQKQSSTPVNDETVQRLSEKLALALSE